MSKPANRRIPVNESMPALAEACPTFKRFPKGVKRADHICDLLQGVIQRHRGPAAKRFYSIREVAKFFGVSLWTVETVYHRLSREGMLTRARSSQTMIAPRAHRPKFALRGVVCMPIWLPGFLHFRDWRIWFSELEEELSRHRFVLEPVFFKQKEDTTPAFVDRVLKFNPDYVVWNAPVSRMTMESITDAGVPILSILTARSPSLPGRIYRTSNDRALKRGLEDWKASGQIDRIVIPYIAGGNVSIAENLLALQTSPLPYQFKPYEAGGPMPKYLATLSPNPRTGIFFADQLLFIWLCALVPDEMFQFFRRHRVIVCRQVTMQSWKMPTDIALDWLFFPGRRLARRIAADLSESKGALLSSEEVFEAEWRPRTPLAEIIEPTF